jgi:hypothetical protein
VQGSQLVQARGERRVGLLVELPQRGAQRCVKLDRGMGKALVVEV